MKRRILQLAICIVAGAVVNTGAAWWCTCAASWKGGAWSEPGSVSSGSETITWLWPDRAPPGVNPNLRWTSVVFGASSIEVSREEPLPSAATENATYFARTQSTRRAGWPFLSFETRHESPSAREWRPRYLTDYVWINSFEEGLWVWGPAGQEQIVIPLKPRWPGFIANTLLYATLLWLLAAAFITTRAARRRRRGRCPHCNYDLGGLKTCPECGRSLSRRKG